MRVWLVGFVLLFVSVELLEWVAQLGSSQPGSYWVVLGGLGLAAASNAKHLPKLGKSASQEKLESSDVPGSVQTNSVDEVEKSVDRSGDSISFRVRSPWR